MAESIITTQKLNKIFQMGDQQVHAVNHLDIALETGSFVMIQGPSGSGKSTLLYMIGGLDTPTSGNIVVRGQDLSRMDENDLAIYRRQDVGYIFSILQSRIQHERLGKRGFFLCALAAPHTKSDNNVPCRCSSLSIWKTVPTINPPNYPADSNSV